MQEVIKPILDEIDQYYGTSFKVNPQDCTPLLLSLTARINDLLPLLSEHEMKQVVHQMKQLPLAMQNKDFVAVRDCLWYELKPMLARAAQRR